MGVAHFVLVLGKGAEWPSEELSGGNIEPLVKLFEAIPA